MKGLFVFMAVLKSAIFHTATGKVGNMILAKAPDGNIIARSAPAKVTINPSDAQLAQQSLFKLIQGFALAYKAFLPVVFKPLKAVHSSMNSFMSAALKAAKENSKTTLDEILKFCNVTRGDAYSEPILQGATATSVDRVVEINCDFASVIPNTDPASNNKVGVYCICPSLGLATFLTTATKRFEISPILNINAYNAPDNYIGAYFVDDVNGEVSTSQAKFKVNGVTNTVTTL